MTTPSRSAISHADGPVPVLSHPGVAPSVPHVAPRKRSIALYALWGLQVALALLFLFAGGIKFVLSADDLTKDTALSATFLRFIGVCEVLGAIGLVVSARGRGRRVLTPLAAAGLVIIMIGATIVTAAQFSAAEALFPLLIGLLLALVVYARRSWLTAAWR